MAVRSELVRRMLRRLEEKVHALAQRVLPEEYSDGLDQIRTPEDRAMVIRFMREVYHEGMSEQIWAAKNPEMYARIVRIAGTVARKEE